MVEILLALYGHPDSPTFWEQHCNEQVQMLGFVPFGPEWPSVYFHKELALVLSIYVDDFKLAGPRENLAKGWTLLRSRVELDTPGPLGLYLGCQQTKVEIVSPLGRPIGVMIYDMEAFLEQCLERYAACSGGRMTRLGQERRTGIVR
jgi:hypothetical protein